VLLSPWFIWTAGGVLGVVGFFAVLWFTEPAQPQPPGVAMLANMAVSDAATLAAALQSAGLRGSADIRGGVDRIKRLDDSRVLVKGWVVDLAAKASQLTIMAFSGGRNVLTTTAGGAHLGFGRALGLSEAAATNPSFHASLPCDHGRPLIIIAVAPDNMYAQLGSLMCP
jgi:hypothetical protein